MLTRFTLLLCLLLTLATSRGAVIISEFVADNSTGLKDENNEYSDWIELFNDGNTTVNLSGWSLTDDSSDDNKWTFPAVTIAPGQYLVVFASAKDRRVAGSNLHTNFSLSSSGEFLALRDPSGNATSIFTPEYPEQFTNKSYGVTQIVQTTQLVAANEAVRALVPTSGTLGTTWTQPVFDDTAWTLGTQGVGFENTPSTLAPLIGTSIKTTMSGINATAYVRIPFTVADVSQLQSLTLKMKYDDGFVAYVNGVEVARRNAPTTPTWNSAATATHATAQVTVYESMDASVAIPALVNGASNVLAIQMLNAAANDSDALVLAELAENEVTGSEFHYFATPSPGSVNGTSYYAFVENPVMSVSHGFFEAAFPVTITTTTPGAQIRYTTNGSAPTSTTGTVYTGPITISNTTVLRAAAFKTGFTASSVATQTYIFLDQVCVQPALPVGFPSSWITATGFYQMNTSPTITNTPQYSSTIMKNALKAIPTISIVTSMDNLFGSQGVYSNPGQEGVAWERPASVEFIDPTGGGHEFWIDCGLRIQGGASRGAGNLKHGLRVLFKEQYGATKLKFPLYAGSPVDEFDTLTLHARFNDLFFNNGNAQYIRDMWCSDTQLDMGRVSPHKTFVHLYLNGAYWGLYDPGEKGDAAFAASHLGGDKSEYDAFNSDENIDGNRTAWDAMFTIANGGLSSDTAYANIKQYLNVPSFIDYMLINLYSGNTDWPGHNWNAARRRVAEAGFEFFSWDAEWTFSNANIDRVAVADGSPGRLWAALRQNAEFRQLVGDHVQKHCFNGGALTPTVTQARWMERATEIDQAIIAESARWGNATRHANWINEQNRLLTSYFPQRTDILVQQFRNNSLFPSNTAPTFSQFGGSVPAGYSFVMTNPNAAGTIIYTTDGTDPRLAGGAIAPGARTYSGPIIINASTLFRARVKDGTTWSAIVEATFFTPQDFTKLAVTEINYNPTNFNTVSGDEFEFVELKNVGNTNLDLGGCTFTNGITYTFPNGTILAPGAFYLLARDATVGQTNFHARYPGVAVNGIYTGKLDNSGETITLSAPTGGHIFDVSYNDSLPWPVSGDGNGFTAVPKSNVYNSDNGTFWRGSANIFGSPGANDPAVSPSVVVNEILTNSELPLKDSIELYNPTNTNVDVSYWWLTDDPNTPKKYQIPSGTVIPAEGYAHFDETQFNPTPGVGLTSFALNAADDDVYVFSGDAGGNLTGYIHGFTFGAAERNVSFGRIVNSGGDEYLTRQISRTFGSANSDPLVGPLVINEIMYHPYSGYDEFIEIRNISNAAVPLYDPLNPSNTWRISGISYTFAVGQSIPAGGYALITALAPATFRAKYNVPGSVQIFGPFAGVLQDNGEHITIEMPDTPYLNTLGQTVVPYIVIDGVHYSNIAPWSLLADGSGPSLQRLNSSAYADEAANWFTDGITGGFPNAANIPSNITITSPAHNSPYTAPATVTFTSSVTDADGTVIKVEYYSGAIKLGESTSAPNFSFAWTSTAGTHSITAKATDNSLGVSTSAPITVYVTPVITQGLKGEYYANKNFIAPIVGTRVDTFSSTNAINFTVSSNPIWPTSYAFPALTTTTNFGVRWSGQILAPKTGNYTFSTIANDGVRLFVNGNQVINNWLDVNDGTTATTASGAVALTIGQLYDITLEYYQNTGTGSINLKWVIPSSFQSNVPQTALYPDSVPIIVNQPAGMAQVETLAVSAASGATSSGNLSVTVTSALIPTTTVSVPLIQGTHNTATLVASAIAASLNAHPVVGSKFTASNSIATITLTTKNDAITPNYDVTLNVAIAAGLGVSAVNTSTDGTSVPVTSLTKDQGTSATFTVLASGHNLSYQWRKNGVFIPGATSQTYTIPYLTPGDAAQYSVFVINSYGFAVSNNSQLTVTFTDTDGDGIQNYWETANALNPNSNTDTALDTDGDGHTNLQEFLTGTNPNDPNSKFSLNIATANSGPGYTLTFTAMPYKSYTVQYKDTLTAPSWITLQTYPATPAQQTITFTDTTATGSRFYRIVTP